MILRQVRRLDVGMKVRRILPDADVPEFVTIARVNPHTIGDQLRVTFWLTNEKQEFVILYPDDFVEIVI